MKKPTAAQRRVLERLAAGETIFAHLGDTWFTNGNTVPAQTFNALLRAGWINGHHDQFGRHWTIDDLGREVLAASPARAEREGSRA